MFNTKPFDVNLSILEAFLYTAYLPNKKYNSLLDVVKMEVPEEEYSGSSIITEYAQPFWWNSDFVKNKPMSIKITNASLLNARGFPLRNLDINMFKIMQEQQKFIPLFLWVSGYHGPVLLENFIVTRKGTSSLFTATFTTTTIIKPYENPEFTAIDNIEIAKKKE